MASSCNSEPLADHEEAAKESEETQLPSQTRYIALYLVVAIVVVMSLAMGIIWAVVKPKHPKVVVQKGYIIEGTSNYSNDDSRLSCVFHFEIDISNPNKKATIYFDTLTATSSFIDKTRNLESLGHSFSLPPDYSIPIYYNFTAEFWSMYGYMPKYLRQGTLTFDILFHAKIRFGLAKWKSHPRTLRIYCSPLVVFHGKTFKPTLCEVDY